MSGREGAIVNLNIKTPIFQTDAPERVRFVYYKINVLRFAAAALTAS
jgi:hypothetical protein